MERREQRESRANEFAGRYGLTHEREALLEAEVAYEEAAKASELKWSAPGTKREKSRRKRIPAEIQEAYDAARLTWKNALIRVEEGIELQLARVPKPDAPRLDEFADSEKHAEAVKRHEWSEPYKEYKKLIEPLTKDKILARTIGFRDTVIREEETWGRARKEAFDEKSQRLLGKLVAFVKRDAKTVAQEYKDFFDTRAQGWADKVGLGDNKKAVEILSRSSRIFGGALIGASLVSLAPIGAAAAGTGFGTLVAIRAARGTFGAVLGTVMGSVSGGLYNKFFGAKNRKELFEKITSGKQTVFGYYKGLELIEKPAIVKSVGKPQVNNAFGGKPWVVVELLDEETGDTIQNNYTVEYLETQLSRAEYTQQDLLADEEAQRKGSGKARARMRKKVEFGTALIGGVGGSIGSAPAFNDLFSESAPVRNAGEQLERVRLDASRQHEVVPTDTNATNRPTTPEQSDAPSSASERGVPGVVDEDGEGTDRAIRELQNHLRGSANPSPALEHFLNSDPNAISQEMGDAYGTRGIVTQPGDRFYFDEQRQNLYFERNGQRQLFLESKNGELVRHNITAESLQPVTGETPTTQHESGNTGSTNAPPQMQETQLPINQTTPEAVPPRGNTLGNSLSGDVPTTAPNTGSGSPQTLGQLLQPDGSEGASTPDTPVNRSGGAVSVQEGQTLGTSLQQQPSGETLGADLLGSVIQEPGFPQEPTVIPVAAESELAAKLGSTGQNGSIFFAHASTPEASLALAQEYGRLHPGVRIFFDNSKYDWGGGKTEQVASLTVGDNKLVQDFTARVLDRDGNPLTSVSASQIRTRIA